MPSSIGTKRSWMSRLAGGSDGFRELVSKADAARDRQEWASAADAYEAALAIRPGNAGIWVQLGNMAKDAKDFPRAHWAYRQALKLKPNDADTHLQMGHLFKLSGDNEEAFASYALAHRLDPNNAWATIELEAIRAAQASPPPMPSTEKPASLPKSTASSSTQSSRKAPRAPRASRPETARGRSFNAQVLLAKTSLQDLLRAGADKRPEAVAALDLAKPAITEAVSALERALQGDKKVIGTSSEADGLTPAIAFDVSDLIQYFRHHRLPTGIQRVQIEAISIALLSARGGEVVKVCCFTEEDDYWREVPPEVFLNLCELSLIAGDWTAPEWRDAMDDLDDLMHQSPDFSFDENSYLVNIGTSWWLQNYFLKVREAKQRSNIRYIAFVHDMIPIMTPQYCVEGLVKDFVGWAQAVYYHADFYFVNSEATRADLRLVGKRLGYDIDNDVIKTVRLDADYRKPGLKLANAMGRLMDHRLASGNYVLFVSTIEARKNHVAIFDAWLELCDRHGDDNMPKLVCVGSRGWLNEAVFAKLSASSRLREKVVMLSNVSDDVLAVLYQECRFSLYPSYYEGWGLPVTEALCYGKPVLVSNSSSLPEAGGVFVDYFTLGDAADLRGKLEKLIFDSSYRSEREAAIRAGFEARSWQSIAEDMQSAIRSWNKQEVAGSRRRPALEPGRYYAFSRNNEIDVYRGLQSGELFRSGNGWWGGNEWGCWLKPGPAQMAFSLPPVDGPYRMYVGLRAPNGIEAPFDLTVIPGKKVRGVIKRNQTKWVVVEFDAAKAGNEIHVVMEGFARHEERPRADLDPITVSVAAIGLFVCVASDMEARARFAEAVSLDDMDALARIVTA